MRTKKKYSNKNAERYFFKYAFPCSYTLMELGRISKKEYEKLKEYFFKGEVPNREILERVFSSAFTRIKKLSLEMKKDYWDLEVIKKYWFKEHNNIINQGEGIYGKAPESFKDLCRINIAEVVEKKNNLLIVKYNDKTRVVFNLLISRIKVGDRIKIHYGYGIEKVDF